LRTCPLNLVLRCKRCRHILRIFVTFYWITIHEHTQIITSSHISNYLC
jgi:hypothetical protein